MNRDPLYWLYAKNVFAITYHTDESFEEYHRFHRSQSMAFYFGAGQHHTWVIGQRWVMVHPTADGRLLVVGQGILEELPDEIYEDALDLFAAMGRDTGFLTAEALDQSAYKNPRSWGRKLMVAIIRQIEWVPEGRAFDIRPLTTDADGRTSSNPYRKIRGEEYEACWREESATWDRHQ